MSGEWWWGFTPLSGFCQPSLACFGQGRCKDARGAPGHILVARSSEQASNASPSHRAHAPESWLFVLDPVGGCTVSLQVQPESAGELTPPGLPTAKGGPGGDEPLFPPSSAWVAQFRFVPQSLAESPVGVNPLINTRLIGLSPSCFIFLTSASWEHFEINEPVPRSLPQALLSGTPSATDVCARVFAHARAHW